MAEDADKSLKRPYKTYPYNFGGIEERYSRYETSRVVILPIPYDSTTSYKGGAREGPEAIIRASRNLEFYDAELGRETYKVGIHTFPEIQPSFKSPEENVIIVRTVIAQVVQDGKFPVILGGEHTLSLGAIQALKEKYPELSVLQLDAHPDIMDEFEGTPYSHACVMRRVYDLCPFVQVGIRCVSLAERQFIEGTDLKSISARQWLSGERDIYSILSHLRCQVYITIDLDVFDPSEMPAVGTPEPGGLGWYDVLDLLRVVAREKEVVGFDVMELCPQGGNIAPDFMAAKLVYKLIGYVIAYSDRSKEVVR